MDVLALFITGLVLVFAFCNGMRDSSTIVATVVSGRALTPRLAFAFCALFEFFGALLFGTAILATVGKKMFGEEINSAPTDVLISLGAALIASLVWGFLSWWRTWPTSYNQALFSALLGSGLIIWGPTHFHFITVTRILLVLVTSPIIGFLLSMGVTTVVRWLGEWMTLRVQPVAEAMHVAACFLVTAAHGSNNGQMIMGLILIALSASGHGMSLTVRAAVAGALALGFLAGGQKILKKMAMSFYTIRAPQGVCAELSSAGLVLACALTGFPASATQVIAGSILGAGAAQNHRAVRWNVAGDIVLGWLVTVPSVGIMAALAALCLKNIPRWVH